ncbi:hypothetical protein [Amycolatopsis japonica]|uniref:hypothetical protein n=1 Tax=Amycolatopsis japonica TaxID=208439 RepID=UPI0033EDC80F
MTEPAPFPENDAANVLTAAKLLDPFISPPGSASAAVQAIVDSVRQLIGEPRIPAALATQWGEAQKTPSAVGTRLREELGSLDAYWQGGAFDAFKTHAEGVIDGCQITAEKVGEVGVRLAEATAFVYQTWGMAIGFITRAAAACAAFLDPLNILDAINSLVDSYADLLESALVTMGEFAANVKAIEISAIGFPEPGTMPSVVSEPDMWFVEPAPENQLEDKEPTTGSGMGESQGGVIAPDEPATAEDEPADEPAGLEETPA